MTDAQKDYILALLDERETDPKFGLSREEIKERVQFLTKADAGRWIDRLRQLPKVPPQPQSLTKYTDREISFPDVPAGRYALKTKAGIKFYRVDRPVEGRWAGWTFVSAQASDELHPIKDPSRVRNILRNIRKNVMEASALYGREIGCCGVCGRTLTNEESRRIGIGPICREKLGRTVLT